jgi:hypothetical protein
MVLKCPLSHQAAPESPPARLWIQGDAGGSSRVLSKTDPGVKPTTPGTRTFGKTCEAEDLRIVAEGHPETVNSS